MKNFIWRIEKWEKRILSAPLTEFEQKLPARFEAVSSRGAATRGENVPMEVVPRKGNAVASPASARKQSKLSMSDRVAILHRGRERAWLEDLPTQLWQSRGRDILTQDGLPVGGSR